MFLIATPIIFLLILLTLGGATNFIIQYFGPAICYPVLWTLGIRFRIEQHGEKIKQPCIYTVNHSSTLDLVTLIALGLPRMRFVAKWELQYNPFFFIVGRSTGQIFIKRRDKEHAIPTLVKTYKRIKKDKLSILVAPEGSRKHEGVIGPFKKGAFRMAIDLGYPIVPIFFEGNNKLSLGGSLLAKSGSITAHIYPPIDTSGWNIRTIDTHISDVRSMYLKWANLL